MSVQFEPIIAREPVTSDQVQAIARAVGMGAMIVDFHGVDCSLGRGVLQGYTRCLWTKRGHRITVSLFADGGLIVSQSKSPDPTRPTEILSPETVTKEQA